MVKQIPTSFAAVSVAVLQFCHYIYLYVYQYIVNIYDSIMHLCPVMSYYVPAIVSIDYPEKTAMKVILFVFIAVLWASHNNQ